MEEKVKPKELTGPPVQEVMNVDVYISAALIIGFLVFYITFLIIFCCRMNHRPIINRSPRLVLISSITNLILTIFLLTQKALPLLKDPKASYWICSIEGGINLFNIPLLFYPYILRAYRLYVVFEVHCKEARHGNDRKFDLDLSSLNQIKEHRLLWNVLGVTSPFIFFFVIFMLIPRIQLYFPYTAVNSCFISKFLNNEHLDLNKEYGLQINVSLILSLVLILTENILFAFAMFKIRHVADDFNITNELKFAYIAWGLCAIVVSFLVCFGPGNMAISWLLSPYLYVIRNVSLFTVTLILPLRASFSPLQAVPQESKACAQNFNIASQTQLPSLFFNNYLRQTYPTSGHLLFQLFMELRLFRSIIGLKESILNNFNNSPRSSSTHNLANLLEEKERDEEPNPFISTQLPQESPPHEISTITESESENELRQRAFFIYSTYLDPSSPFHVRLPQEFILDARARLNIQPINSSQDSEERAAAQDGPDVSMYDKLLSFVTQKLEDYYDVFKASPSFQELLREIEMKEVTYNILLKLRMTQGLS